MINSVNALTTKTDPNDFIFYFTHVAMMFPIGDRFFSQEKREQLKKDNH
jgi:hypothetical protein